MSDEEPLLVSELSVDFQLGLARNVETEVPFVLLLHGRRELVVRWRREARNLVQNIKNTTAFA